MSRRVRIEFKLTSEESCRTSNETFGALRNLRTSSVGSEEKQRTLRHPLSRSCSDSSRANVSVPPIRDGLTPNTDTAAGIDALSIVEVLTAMEKSLTSALESGDNALFKVPNAQVSAMGSRESAVQEGRLGWTHKSRFEICLVAEAQYPLVLFRQVS